MHWGEVGEEEVVGGVCRSTWGLPYPYVQVAEAALACLCRHCRRVLMAANCVRRRPFMQCLHIHPTRQHSHTHVFIFKCSSRELPVLLPLFLHPLTSPHWRFCNKPTHMFPFWGPLERPDAEAAFNCVMRKKAKSDEKHSRLDLSAPPVLPFDSFSRRPPPLPLLPHYKCQVSLPSEK